VIAITDEIGVDEINVEDISGFRSNFQSACFAVTKMSFLIQNSV
jgi:hypothetical protein